MAMFQIQQLNSTKDISIEQQKNVCGSGDDPLNLTGFSDIGDPDEHEELWRGYANGNYNVTVKPGGWFAEGDNVAVFANGKQVAGEIDLV